MHKSDSSVTPKYTNDEMLASSPTRDIDAIAHVQRQATHLVVSYSTPAQDPFLHRKSKAAEFTNLLFQTKRANLIETYKMISGKKH